MLRINASRSNYSKAKHKMRKKRIKQISEDCTFLQMHSKIHSYSIFQKPTPPYHPNQEQEPNGFMTDKLQQQELIGHAWQGKAKYFFLEISSRQSKESQGKERFHRDKQATAYSLQFHYQPDF